MTSLNQSTFSIARISPKNSLAGIIPDDNCQQSSRNVVPIKLTKCTSMDRANEYELWTRELRVPITKRNMVKGCGPDSTLEYIAQAQSKAATTATLTSLTVCCALFNIVSLFTTTVDDSYCMSSRLYEVALCVPIVATQVASMVYLYQRRRDAQPTEKLHSPSYIQLAMITLMVAFVISSYLLYLIPYTIGFWHCDKALAAKSDFEKASDVCWYFTVATFLLSVMIYSLQRAATKPKKLYFEFLIDTSIPCLFFIVFVKIIVDKVHATYRKFPEPEATPHTLVFLKKLNPQHQAHESDGYKCDANSLQPLEQVIMKWNDTIFGPAVFLLTAELLPLLFCLHWTATSEGHKTYPDGDLARFQFPQKLPSWLIRYVYRLAAIIPCLGMILFLAYRFVHTVEAFKSTNVSSYVRTEDENERMRVVVDVLRIILFVAVYFGIFLKQPKRYNWWNHRPYLRKCFKTDLYEHSKFDDFILIVCMFIKIPICVLYIIDCTYSNSKFEPADGFLSLIAMFFEWLVIRNMLILNDAELFSYPLMPKLDTKSNLGFGPTLAFTCAVTSFLAFLEEFVKSSFLKMELISMTEEENFANSVALEVPDVNRWLRMLSWTESLQFGVTLYFFTCAMCWLGVLFRYISYRAFSILPLTIRKRHRRYSN